MLTRSRLSHSAHTSALPALGLAVVGALTLAAYVPFLSTGFAATDSLPLVETSRLANLGSVARLFMTPVMGGTAFALGEVVYRPFVSLTFGFDYLVWGPDSVGYHVSNLVLHLVAVGAVWLLLIKMGLSRWSSILGATIFALHPVVLATVPVIGRRDSIVPVTAFAASAVLVLIAEDVRTWRRKAILAVALLMAVIALLSKESAFVAVGMLPIILASRAFARGTGLSGALKSMRLAVPSLLVAALLFVLRLSVLGGMGGTPDADVGFVDFYRYGVLIGAYVRDLLWAFADLAPATREVWLRLAELIAFALALSVVWLPRRQAVLAAAGALWVIAFGIFCAVFKITTVGWLAYFSLIGVALLLAAGLEGALLRVRVGLRNVHLRTVDSRGRGLRVGGWANILGTLSSALLLLGLLIFAASSLWASALFRAYPQWQVAGDVESRYMQALTACVAATPDVSYVSLQQVPGSFEDGRPETVMLGVTLVEQYTAESALRLAFPQRDLSVHVGSVGTLHEAPANLQFSCDRLPNGVEFATIY